MSLWTCRPGLHCSNAGNSNIDQQLYAPRLQGLLRSIQLQEHCKTHQAEVVHAVHQLRVGLRELVGRLGRRGLLRRGVLLIPAGQAAS